MADNKNGKNAASTNNLTLKQKIGYAAGDCGGVITLIFVGSYLNRYATNILEIPYATLAVILLVWNIWDMVNDPLIGNLMDRAFAKATPGKDKFRPWILASIPVIVFGMIAFFTVPGMFDGMTRVAMLFVLKIVYEWGYTMMNIGMGSLLGAMALNDTERASLSSARGIGSSVAQLVAGVMIQIGRAHV